MELCANTSLGFCWKRSLSGGYRVTALVTNLDCFRSRAVSPFWRGDNPDFIFVHELIRAPQLRTYPYFNLFIPFHARLSHLWNAQSNNFMLRKTRVFMLRLKYVYVCNVKCNIILYNLNNFQYYIFMQILDCYRSICSKNIHLLYIGYILISFIKSFGKTTSRCLLC